MEVSSVDFKEKMFDCTSKKYKQDRPALVELYTDWCTACKSLNPTLEKLNLKYNELIDVIKVNITTDDDLAGAFDVQSVPTMIFMKNGSITKRLIGAQSPMVLEKAVADCLL